MADVKGLKRLRSNNRDSTPQFECGNCGCKRYSPCGCSKGRSTKRKKKEV